MTRGIIAGGSRQTADAGAEILRRGGNAVDAAVGAAFASFVAECAISTIGGGGFATVAGPGIEPVVYDFFVNAPGLGTDGSLPANLDFAAVSLTFSDATECYHVGRGSSAVPGNVAGLARLLAEAGTMPLTNVVQPAVRLAREGYALSPAQAGLFELLSGILTYTPGSAALYAPDGHVLRAGERFANPAFADTLEHLAARGPQTFYAGDLADALLADQRAHGGLITAQDLTAYRVEKRQPLSMDYRGRTIVTNPPPSLGGILVAYALGLLAQTRLAGIQHGSAAHVALLAEVMRAANTAREADHPEALEGPEQWAALLGPDRLAADWQAVMRYLRQGPPRHAADDPGGPRSTTHISVMDENGLAVGLTTTPGETGGYVVGDTGLLMNNCLGEDDLNPEGFHRWAAGMRLPSMMAPTIVLDADGPCMVLGSGGASRLRSAILQTISNRVDFGQPADQAANQARVHFERGLLDLEAGYDPVAADMLEVLGYRVNRWSEKSLYFGGAHLVVRDTGGTFSGGGDRRRGGAVVVVA